MSAAAFHDLFSRIGDAGTPAELELLAPVIASFPHDQQRLDLAKVWLSRWRDLAPGRDPDVGQWAAWPRGR